MAKRDVPLSLLTPEQDAALLESVKKARELPLEMGEQTLASLVSIFHSPHVEAGEVPDWVASHPFVIARHNTKAKEIDGRMMYRTPGKFGKWLRVEPFYWSVLKKLRDTQADASKAERKVRAATLYKSPRSKTSRNARKVHAAEVAAEIRAAAVGITGSSRIKRIAKKTGYSASTVKRALANKY